jgi:hypothetical protein
VREWPVVETEELNRDLLKGLFDDKIAAIVVPGFIAEEKCELAVKGILAHGFEYYKYVYPRIGKIGITQFEYSHNSEQKKEYFAKVPQANAVRKEMFRQSGDLVPRVVRCLREVWGENAEIATEEGTREQYFAGLVRVLSEPLLLHYDWAPFDGPAWTISQISAQSTWNIFLQTGLGGATVVYDRPWKNESDEIYAISGSYEYEHLAVKGAYSVRITPRAGDLILFNSRNFHEVEETKGEMERITVSSFIGLIEAHDKLIFWS